MNNMTLSPGKNLAYKIAYDAPTDEHINVIYESENFVVIYFPSFPQKKLLGRSKPFGIRHGFEIINRNTDTEVYLHDDWATLFSEHLSSWKQDVPEQDVVEKVLAGYASLGQLPMIQQ